MEDFVENSFKVSNMELSSTKLTECPTHSANKIANVSSIRTDDFEWFDENVSHS